MNAQDVDSTTLDEPTLIRSMPDHVANGLPFDGGIEEIDLEDLFD